MRIIDTSDNAMTRTAARRKIKVWVTGSMDGKCECIPLPNQGLGEFCHAITQKAFPEGVVRDTFADVPDPVDEEHDEQAQSAY